MYGEHSNKVSPSEIGMLVLLGSLQTSIPQFEMKTTCLNAHHTSNIPHMSAVATSRCSTHTSVLGRCRTPTERCAEYWAPQPPRHNTRCCSRTGHWPRNVECEAMVPRKPHTHSNTRVVTITVLPVTGSDRGSGMTIPRNAACGLPADIKTFRKTNNVE